MARRSDDTEAIEHEVALRSIDECRKLKGAVVSQKRRARRRRHAVARRAQRWPGASARQRPVLEPVAGFWVGSSLRGWPPLILRLTAERSAARAAPLCGAARLQPKEMSHSLTAC